MNDNWTTLIYEMFVAFAPWYLAICAWKIIDLSRFTMVASRAFQIKTRHAHSLPFCVVLITVSVWLVVLFGAIPLILREGFRFFVPTTKDTVLRDIGSAFIS